VDIDILLDKSTDFSSISNYLEKTDISYHFYKSTEDLENHLSVHRASPLIIPGSLIDQAEELADKSLLVIVDTEYTAENILQSLRSGAEEYFSLDGKTGSFESLIEHLSKIWRSDVNNSEQYFKIASQQAYHSEFWFDPNDKLIFQSPSIERMTGFPLQKFLDDSPEFFFSIVHPYDLKTFLDKEAVFLKDINNPPLIQQYRIITKTGEIRWWENIIQHIFDHRGTYIGRRGTSRDITKQILAEQETEKIIKEKELLVKEVHHRVKNNLAVITGILNLQKLYLHDERDTYILNILKNRMDSMISVHELLYSGKSTDTFDLEDLSKTLAMNLVHSTDLISQDIEIVYNINPVPVKSELASPLGLILNELITNCLKYAFTDRPRGRIYIGFNILDEIRTLYVEDDGVGFPVEVIAGENHNLGLTLVKSLASQLGGELLLNNNNGSQAVIVFPAQPEK